MTDSQVKYQTYLEEARHNLAMERYSAKQADATALNAETKAKELEFNIETKWPFERDIEATKKNIEMYNAQTNRYKAGAAIAGSFLGGVFNIANLFA